MKYLDEQQRQDDIAFRAVLLKDIPYFHRLYAKYKNPQSLEIAKGLGNYASSLKRRITTLTVKEI